MKFGIRDDDICYFTEPSTVRRVYGDIWDEIPVTTACVPFVSGDSDVVYETSGENKKYPISDNEELTSFLRTYLDRDCISIELHGYNHAEYNNSPEFVAGPNLTKRIKVGIAELESVFETEISVFVPPHARISRTGVRAVSQVDLDICREFSPLPREFQIHPKWVASYLRMVHFYFTKGTDYRYPQKLDYGTHNEIYCHRMNENADLETLKRAFEYVKRNEGNFCLSMHAGGLTDAGKKAFDEFINFVHTCDTDIQFATIDMFE